ncbi:MAG: glucose 1-dehydrogenase [Syntrophobacteraceae bacterium]
MSKRVAIVTGGARGIGKSIGMQLVREGSRVVLVDRDRETGADAARELGARGNVFFLHADVSDEASVRAMVKRTVDQFGRVDALVNNAGIADPAAPPIESLDLADWERMIRNNLTSVFLCVKHTVRFLKAERGAIVNIASTRAVQSEANTEPYSASKGGIVALTHALAVSLGPEVRVNCISPGWIDVHASSTDIEPGHLRSEDHAQHPVGRVGLPGDVAELAAFLVSDKAGFITGQNFIVDGGMTRKMIYVD